MKSKIYIGTGIIIFIIIISIVAIMGYHSNSVGDNKNQAVTTHKKTIQIVPAKNFWSSLISQLGGTHVQVLSIVSDPNADPHEYASSTENARAIANADYIICLLYTSP